MLQQVNAPGWVRTEPVRAVMVPSASGGMGHIPRAATPARAPRPLDPAVERATAGGGVLAAARLLLAPAARQRAQRLARRLGAA